MSRVGKKPITIPAGVTINVTSANEVVVKGPKGELRQQIDRDMKVEVKDGVLEVSRPTDLKRHMALHGLYRALIANMVEGVSNGYKRTLELVGCRISCRSCRPANRPCSGVLSQHHF